MELIRVRLTDIRPYENNPRINDKAVDAVAESIRECGYDNPIIVDENFVILAGHTRYKALKKLGWTECEVIIKDDLDEEQKKKYRLYDNKTNELAEWDVEKLEQELSGLDMSAFDIDWGKGSLEVDFFEEEDCPEEKSNQYECDDCGYIFEL